MTSKILLKRGLLVAVGLLLPLMAQTSLSARPLPPIFGGKTPPLISFLPRGDLEDFVVAQFDIRTINTSMNRDRAAYQARLMELGYRPQARQKTSDPLVLKSNDGTITLSLFERGDHNLDGIEDILVCMTDQTNDGRFRATQPLILQKYSETTPLVALAVGVSDSRCPRAG